MRWLALLLLFANLGLAGYLVLVAPGQRSLHDAPALELHGDKVKQLRDASSASGLACLEWGPLGAAEVLRAQEQLTKLQIDKISVRELPGTPVWWVYITPARSREEADRRLKEVEDLGVKDARVVADEGYRNAVSLGIFRTEEAAVAHQTRMREIKVRNTAIVQRSDLLKFSTIVVSQPTTAAAAKLVELRSAFAGSEVKASACPAAGG